MDFVENADHITSLLIQVRYLLLDFLEGKNLEVSAHQRL